MCFDLAQRMCAPGNGCAYGHIQGEYECRSWFRYQCCGESKSCSERISVDFGHLAQCRLEVERTLDCNRLYTPACFGLLPASQTER
jgi:hypothetical protein